MSNIAIKIENLRKQYRLGAIGGQTLNAELQSWWARVRGKEDPNSKLGQSVEHYGERFWALDGINLEIKKGEAVGIIGSNGAGKSTLLKILSRVTAPTEGDVWIDGRIASMLEVGTGFHGELTGRENIYMNGAILGMTKKEVDAKIESIIDFSECRQFIDTPVKRYSSGMYVKLAFAVASHLDAEIMIMDEVLAVGDMKFQKKCLGKMGDEAAAGKTVLYVSHNMNTIRRLCTRCIILNHGKLVYDGEVEKGISLYLQETVDKRQHNDFTIREYDPWITAYIKIECLDVIGSGNLIRFGDKFSFVLTYKANKNVERLVFRTTVLELDRTAVATAVSNEFACFEGETYTRGFEIDTSAIAPGDYMLQIVAFEPNDVGNQVRHDYLPCAVCFTVFAKQQLYNFVWNNRAWGNHILPNLVDISLDNNSK